MRVRRTPESNENVATTVAVDLGFHQWQLSHGLRSRDMRKLARQSTQLDIPMTATGRARPARPRSSTPIERRPPPCGAGSDADPVLVSVDRSQPSVCRSCKILHLLDGRIRSRMPSPRMSPTQVDIDDQRTGGRLCLEQLTSPVRSSRAPAPCSCLRRRARGFDLERTSIGRMRTHTRHEVTLTVCDFGSNNAPRG